MDFPKWRLSLPYMSATTNAFGLDWLMGRWDASLENVPLATSPQLPYVSTAMGVQAGTSSIGLHLSVLCYTCCSTNHLA